MTRAEKRLRAMGPELYDAVVEAHDLLSMIWERSVMPSAIRPVILRLDTLLAKARGEQP